MVRRDRGRNDPCHKAASKVTANIISTAFGYHAIIRSRLYTGLWNFVFQLSAKLGSSLADDDNVAQWAYFAGENIGPTSPLARQLGIANLNIMLRF